MNLLIVDEHPTSLKQLRAQLEAEGHAIFEAHDGIDALALLERQPVDVVISDILMPRMDGYRLCHEIRQHARLRDLPIIIYTSAGTSSSNEHLALGVSADKCLKKPSSVETFVAALHEVIALRAAPRAEAREEAEKLKEHRAQLVHKPEERNTELQAQIEALRLQSAALTAAANAILIANRDGTIVWVNPAFTTLTGYTLTESVGKNSRDLVKSGRQKRAVYEEMWATILAGRVWHGQLVNRRKDGSLYPEEQTITPMRDARGEITHFITIKQDLSERRHAEEALHASERKFQSVFEQAAVGVIIAGSDRDHFVNVNRRFCEMVGYSAGELLQLGSRDITHPDDIAADTDQLEQINFGIVREFFLEKRYRRKDGSLVWAKTFVAPLDPAEAKPTLWIGVIVDITERKRAEEALRQSEEHYRSLFDNMLNGFAYCRMIFADGRPRDFTYLEVNGAFETLTGLKEVVGKNVSAVIPGICETDPQLLEIYGRVALTGVPEQFERYVRALGMWFAISVYSPQREHFVAVFDVITERKQAEAALRAAKQQLHALVGRLHAAREEEAKRIARELHDDLGQQLTSLNMELSDLEMKLPGAAPAQRSQIARMHLIVDHTIQVVQKIAGELRLAQLDVLGLTAAIDWQLKEFSQRSAIPSRITRLDEVANLSEAQGTAVFRILQEALTNIVRHAGATAVEVGLQAEPDQLTLKVHDNGRGISAAEMNAPQAIGLLGMRERAQTVGGDVTITGGAGAGTTVLVRIPLHRTGAIPA